MTITDDKPHDVVMAPEFEEQSSVVPPHHFITFEELKTEAPLEPMSLKKKSDSSLLKDLLEDSNTKNNGCTESTYRVIFLQNIFLGGKYALKIFPSGRGNKQAEKDFKHESKMHIEALKKVNGGADHFLVLAVEMGCGPKPITLPTGKKITQYNYLLTK